ncbi:transposase [Fusobacterium sp. THCT13E1]
MFRLFLILSLFSKSHTYSPHNSKLDLSSNLIRLCGFFPDQTPIYSTYFYFLKRIKVSTFMIIQILNKARVLLTKFFFKNYYSNAKHIILAIDSKPIATDGSHPSGIIHSHNKYLDGKLGIKIHTLSIVYPFIMPIAFDFTLANYNDSPILRKLIPIIAPISADLNTAIYLTADKGYYGYENIEACTLNNVIPIICPRKNSKTETYQKFFQVEDKVFCIHSKLRLCRNGYDKHQNRINYRCYNKECSHSCSHRVWIPLGSSKYRKIPSEYFFSMKSYIDSSVSNFFKNIYTHRSKIELLHGIWSKSYNLRNTIYLRNLTSLNLFELKLINQITYDSIFKLKCSLLQK